MVNHLRHEIHYHVVTLRLVKRVTKHLQLQAPPPIIHKCPLHIAADSLESTNLENLYQVGRGYVSRQRLPAFQSAPFPSPANTDFAPPTAPDGRQIGLGRSPGI